MSIIYQPVKTIKGLEILSINCFNPSLSVRAIQYSSRNFEFESKKILSPVKPDNLPSDIKHIEIPMLNTRDLYSKFCFTELYKHVSSDHVMMIHDDGFIINPHLWQDDFLAYDYIGSPWPGTSKSRVGNGGFCIRSRKLINLCSKIPHITENEDWEICVINREWFEANGCSFAPVDLACKFSLELQIAECEYNLNNTFGFHGLRSQQHIDRANLIR